MDELVSKITDRFLISEPAYLRLMCTHNMLENQNIKVPFRVGKGLIEYNKLLFKGKSFDEILGYLKVELTRIALKHPYTRKPFNCSLISCAIGSDCAIYDKQSNLSKIVTNPDEYQLPEGECYEWYAYKLERLLNMPSEPPPPQGNKGGNNANQDQTQNESNSGSSERQNQNQDSRGGQQQVNEQMQELMRKASISETWEEDELMQDEINQAIADIAAGSQDSWGSMSVGLRQRIMASLVPKLDYRQILRNFHTSCLSSARNLTRMKPSRRFGFEQMGSKYRLNSNILVAVDLSSSVTDDELVTFFSAINRFFKYGVEKLDVITFDVNVTGVYSWKRAKKEIEVTGRGGTNFQAPLDWLLKSRTRYDGLIYFTDGECAPPEVPQNLSTKILWVLTKESKYNAHHEQLEAIKRGTKSCFISLKK